MHTDDDYQCKAMIISSPDRKVLRTVCDLLLAMVVFSAQHHSTHRFHQES